ncbi:MAG: M43 family zinc metalloprotease [Bacteroidota bacterium]
MQVCKAIPVLIVCMMLYCFPDFCNAQQRPSSTYVDSVFSNSNALRNNCSVDNLLNELRKDPSYAAREKKMNDEILKAMTTVASLRMMGNGPVTTVILPVVVHIINENPLAYTDAQIANGIKDLNDAFSKSGAYAASQGADTKIQFALAQKDPDGGITTGITRTSSHYSVNMNMYSEDYRLKNLINWDPAKYINIWLVSNIVGEISAGFGCGVWTRMNAGGYATLPTGSSFSTDGIVVPGFGIVLAHEMGHYLGLYHTFEGGCTNNNCLTDGDRVCDTPPDGTNTPTSDCSKPGNSCTTDTLSSYSNGFFPRDTVDMASNFMDYNNAACTNQFTEGQAERMRTAIATQRSGLLSDVITKPCGDNIIAGFTRDIADPKVGELINFINTSSITATYQWIVDGVQQATTRDFSWIFTAPAAKHSVTLKVFNTSSCYATYTDYVLTNCGLTARFSNNKRFIASETNVLNDTILFTNNSMNTLTGITPSYEWILTNNITNTRQTITTNASGAGGPDDLNYIFPTFGNFSLRLKATGGGCADSSELLYFTVADPKPDVYMAVFGANCYANTKVRVSFYICNFGYAPIPPNIPITFYDDDPKKPGARKLGSSFFFPDSIKGYCCGKVYYDTLDVGYEKLNKIYAVANNITSSVPVVLPDPAATLVEKDYTNNIGSYQNFRFKASITPSAAAMEPGDTLQLKASGSPEPGVNFAWSPPASLSCVTCSNPFFYADTTASTIKQVIVKSSYQCIDTAYIDIKVPVYNDFVVAINSIACSGTDSLLVNFTVSNIFKRGIIPKDLLVAFYKDDPQTSAAVLLAPVFKVPDSVLAKQKVYTWKIKKIKGGNIFASVNDNGSVVPVQSSNAPVAEKDYTNNFNSYNYQLVSATIDTSICTGQTFAGYSASGNYRDTLVTAAGCDSVRILNLVVKTAAITKTNIIASICEGDNYAGHTTTGTFIDVYPGANACDSIRTLTLTVNPVIHKTYDVKICKGDSYFAVGKLQTKSGTYIDTTKSFAGCDSITTTNLSVYPLPSGFLPKDSTLCLGKTLSINLSGYTTVNWSTGSTSNSIVISPPSASYSVQVTDRNGCNGADTINVVFQKCIPIQVPNAFTPNADGKNDVFRPVIGVATSNYTMQIWSRWGQLFFETHNSSVGWNGKYNGIAQPSGVFVYVITFTDPDGVAVKRTGTLVLIR